jgi:hypothetical protein
MKFHVFNHHFFLSVATAFLAKKEKRGVVAFVTLTESYQKPYRRRFLIYPLGVGFKKRVCGP